MLINIKKILTGGVVGMFHSFGRCVNFINEDSYRLVENNKIDKMPLQYLNIYHHRIFYNMYLLPKALENVNVEEINRSAHTKEIG